MSELEKIEVLQEEQNEHDPKRKHSTLAEKLRRAYQAEEYGLVPEGVEDWVHYTN